MVVMNPAQARAPESAAFWHCARAVYRTPTSMAKAAIPKSATMASTSTTREAPRSLVLMPRMTSPRSSARFPGGRLRRRALTRFSRIGRLGRFRLLLFEFKAHVEMRQRRRLVRFERLREDGRRDHQEFRFVLVQRFAAKQVAQKRDVPQERDLLLRLLQVRSIQSRDGETLAVLELDLSRG